MPVGKKAPKFHLSLDYSKWDAIELSDDEDFECHPNVDKKSMIRWKQSQIHKERREREDQRDLLKMEYNTTEKFLDQVPKKLTAINVLPPAAIPGFLSGLAQEMDKSFTDPMRQESLKRMNIWPGNWEAPTWGDVLKTHVPWNEEINTIMRATEEYLAKGVEPEKCASHVQGLFDQSFAKFKLRQPIIMKQIKAFEEEMAKKLTMDHLVTGFDKTFVAKPEAGKLLTANEKGGKTKVIETIHFPKSGSSKEPVVDEFLMGIFEEMEARDEDLLAVHPSLLEFSRKSDYGDIVKILRDAPTIQKEKSEEILLLRALCMASIGKNQDAKTCVQNSLIIKYTRNLGGKEGVDLFFSKLHGTGSGAQNLFFGDLQKTYDHVLTRGAVLREQRVEKKIEHEMQAAKKKEIYESFLQPDGTLKLTLGDNPTESDIQQKEWFDNLPEDYKQGLLLEDVDKINAYLGSLSPDEASFQANIAAKSGFIQFEEESDTEQE